MLRSSLALCLPLCLLAACQGDGRTGDMPAPPASRVQSNHAAGALPPLAYIEGAAITWADLQPGLIEASGGQVLSELVIERAIDRRLAERGERIDEQELAAERRRLMETLDPDPDRAQRLLQDLRERHGLDERRFHSLLARNAGLRRLVQDQVQVSDTAIQQAYQFQYGPRYEARLIAVENLTQAADMIRRARAGESFMDLAIQHSTDSSRAQGGLLPPISPVDPSYPAAVRTALTRLHPAEVSDPVALEEGYAVLRLERKIEGQDVKLDDVRDDLARDVRRQLERMLMEQQAKVILNAADIVVLDPRLQRSWTQQKRRMNPEQ